MEAGFGGGGVVVDGDDLRTAGFFEFQLGGALSVHVAGADAEVGLGVGEYGIAGGQNDALGGADEGIQLGVRGGGGLSRESRDERTADGKSGDRGEIHGWPQKVMHRRASDCLNV